MCTKSLSLWTFSTPWSLIPDSLFFLPGNHTPSRWAIFSLTLSSVVHISSYRLRLWALKIYSLCADTQAEAGPAPNWEPEGQLTTAAPLQVSSYCKWVCPDLSFWGTPSSQLLTGCHRVSAKSNCILTTTQANSQSSLFPPFMSPHRAHSVNSPQDVS